jgi:hypothetical protein
MKICYTGTLCELRYSYISLSAIPPKKSHSRRWNYPSRPSRHFRGENAVTLHSDFSVMLPSSQRQVGKSWVRQPAEHNPAYRDMELGTTKSKSNVASGSDGGPYHDACHQNILVDPSAILDMDMMSLRRELSRCYKALISLQSRTGTQEHVAHLENEIQHMKSQLAVAQETIKVKDSMLNDLAQAANDMSQCSQRQLTLMMSTQQKNSCRIREIVETMSQQLASLEHVNHELSIKIRSLMSVDHHGSTDRVKVDDISMQELFRSPRSTSFLLLNEKCYP